MHTRSVGLAVVVLLAGIGGTAAGQPVGTFRWQLQPFCNVVTVAITQNGAVYRLEGTDDQCGAGAASVTGTAFPNADGSIGFGLNIVTAPGGRPVHVDAAISLGNFSGTWRDSIGATGTFVLTPGAGTGGSARPLPLPASSVPAAIILRQDGGFVAHGTAGGGAIPASGPGVRAMWHAGKAAFRAGTVNANQWDDANVGPGSVAFGYDTVASHVGSFAAGQGSTASADGATALGRGTSATAPGTTAMGSSTSATALGSTAMGLSTIASGNYSTAMGGGTRASGVQSVAMGILTLASGANALAGGDNSVAGGVAALAFGQVARADGNGSVALGTNATAAANGSFVFADRSVFTELRAPLPNQFFVRAGGGVKFFSNPGATLGVELAPNGTQWLSLSDVRTKHHFRALDGDDVLQRIATMPVSEWSYKEQDGAIRHIGPTAQDFHAAFDLGEDPLRIGTLDADGVALAGVKAVEARTRHLSERLAALEAKNASLLDDNAAIRDRLARLEQRLGKQ